MNINCVTANTKSAHKGAKLKKVVSVMMDNKDYENGEKLRGVGCDVVSCKYHGCDNCCHASSIVVESQNAIRKAETFCSTFETKTAM
jgi:hypothetical protein